LSPAANIERPRDLSWTICSPRWRPSRRRGVHRVVRSFPAARACPDASPRPGAVRRRRRHPGRDGNDLAQGASVRPAQIGGRHLGVPIAYNRCIDVGRRSREHRHADTDLFAIPDPAAGSDAGVATAQQEEHVRAALDALPREQFKMVQLAFFEGLSHATIAARTNLPIGTVKSRLRLAFSRLRRVLQDAGVSEALQFD
jgi:hypothetical protein